MTFSLIHALPESQWQTQCICSCLSARLSATQYMERGNDLNQQNLIPSPLRPLRHIFWLLPIPIFYHLPLLHLQFIIFEAALYWFNYHSSYLLTNQSLISMLFISPVGCLTVTRHSKPVELWHSVSRDTNKLQTLAYLTNKLTNYCSNIALLPMPKVRISWASYSANWGLILWEPRYFRVQVNVSGSVLLLVGFREVYTPTTPARIVTRDR